MTVVGAGAVRVDATGAKSATRRHLRGSSLLLVGRLLSKGLNFGVQVLVVRYLTKSDFGAFAYALGIVAITQTVVTFGLDRAVTRFVPIYHEQADYGRLFGTLLLVVASMIGLGLATLTAVYGLEFALGASFVDDPVARAVVRILILLAPLQALDAVMVGLFAVFAKPKAIFFRKHIVAPCLKLAVVVALIVANASVLSLAAGYVLAELVGIAIYAFMLLRLMRSQALFDALGGGPITVPWREILAFTVPLLTSDLVYVSMQATNTVMLEHFSDTVQVAALRAVLPAAIMNQMVFASFATLFTPAAARMFARGDSDGVNRLYWQTAIWIAVLSFPIFALTFSLAQPFTVLVYGSGYETSGVILSVLALGYYFNSALGFNGLTLKVFGSVRAIVALNVAAVLVNIVANLLLIPRYGALGAALGTAGTLIVHNILKQLALRYATGVHFFEPRYVRVYTVVTVAALGLLAVQTTTDLPVAANLALAVGASLVVLRINRGLLNVEETLPELMRIPLAATLLRTRSVPQS
jgi:O-antigen/teichoic acid export membrane protein